MNCSRRKILQSLCITEEYAKTKATLSLMMELIKGFRSGEEEGWLSEEKVANKLHKQHMKTH